MNTRFVFTGTFHVSSNEGGRGYLREGKTKAGDAYKSLNFSVVAEKNNRAFVELFGIEREKITAFDVDGNRLEVAWADRNDEEVMAAIRSKRIVATGTERKEFLTELDQVNYIVENLDAFNGKLVTVTGSVSKNIYNGSISDRFQMRNIYIESEDAKPKLRIFGDFYWAKDSLDVADFVSDKKVRLNGYMQSYVSDERRNMYVPQSVVLDCSKVDVTNEKHVKLLKFKLNAIGLDYENGKVVATNKLKAGVYYAIGVEFSYVNGAEAIPFSEDMLTDFQREQVELGLKTLDDFRPAGTAYGERIREYRIVGYESRDEYADGMIVIDKAKAFEEDVYTPRVVTAKAEDIMNAPETAVPSDEDMDDLFG